MFQTQRMTSFITGLTDVPDNYSYEDYALDYHRNNPDSSLEPADIVAIIETIRSGHSSFPCNSFIFEYIIAHISENNTECTLYPPDIKLFSDEVWILEFRAEGSRHYMFLDSDQYERLRVLLLLIDTNTGFEIRTTVDQLRGSSDFREHEADLIYYGLCKPKAIIPEISEEIIDNGNISRFSSALWFDEIQKKEIVLAGLGGIGSYVAYLLSRVGPNHICMYDDDRVEFVNMSGQMYNIEDIGLFKVNAAARMMSRYSQYNGVFCVPERYIEESTTSDVMICGFDNMSARRVFFNNWLSHIDIRDDNEKSKCLFIDGRLDAEEFQVFCIRGNDEYNILKYKELYLFDDKDADPTVCSYKQTSHMANMIASVMVNLFVNFVSNCIVENLRSLPFITTYNGSAMLFKTVE